METVRYESLLLVVPEITNDESAEIEKSIDKKIQSFKGKLLSYDKWGKYLLAYPIKKNEYGIYFLARFDIPAVHKQETLKELMALFDIKLGNVIMRHVLTKLENDAPLDYKRPQSLDETPKDVDQFIKKHRMSSFTAPKKSEPQERQKDEQEQPQSDEVAEEKE
jgi:small subunit ribosomal protein S6